MTTLKEEINQATAVDTQEINTLQKQITEAVATLESIAEVRDVDVEVAQAEVGRSIAKLRQAEESLKLTQVKAPTDGQIIKINAYPGELVSEDKGVKELDVRIRLCPECGYEQDRDIAAAEIVRDRGLTDLEFYSRYASKPSGLKVWNTAVGAPVVKLPCPRKYRVRATKCSL